MVSVRRGFVLAAGLGTRLRPLTDELPKPAWPFFDVPLAAHVLGTLASAGVDEVIVNLHHLGDRLQEVLSPWIPSGLRVLWSEEPEILGTGGALLPWRQRLADGPFFLCNADTIQEIDLLDLSRFHEARGALATLAVRPLPPGAKAPLEVAADGRIVRFLQSRAPGAPPGVPCEFTGVHRLEPALLRDLPAGRFCINADVHARLVARGEPLFGYAPPEEAFWSDLGTPERYLEAHRAFLSAGKLPPGAPGRPIPGDEETEAGGRIVGPSYLGPRARVGARATAGPFAVLGAGVVLEGGTRVEESVVWAGCRLGGETLRKTVRSPSGNGLSSPAGASSDEA